MLGTRSRPRRRRRGRPALTLRPRRPGIVSGGAAPGRDAALTRSAVKGTSRMRAPVASKIGVADRGRDDGDRRFARARGFDARGRLMSTLSIEAPAKPSGRLW